MRISKISAVFVIVALLLAAPVFAQAGETGQQSEMAQAVVDTLTLLFLLIATYIAMELYNMMKGGQLAASWGFFSGAVVIFALIKVIEVAARAGYFPVPDVLLSVGYLFVALFFLLGFIKQRKTLG